MPRLVPDETWAVLTIWQEARGEAAEGRVAVAEVIRNRMRRQYQSDGTVVGTVLRPYQFSGWNTRDVNRRLSAVLHDDDPSVIACRDAWHLALEGSEITNGAVLYCNPKVIAELPLWVAASREVAVIGRHHFYVPGEWA